MTVSCPICKKPMKGPLSLLWHGRKEHPESQELVGIVVRRESAKQLAQMKLEKQAANGKMTPGLRALYHNCPCGKTYEQHLEARRALGVPT